MTPFGSILLGYAATVGMLCALACGREDVAWILTGVVVAAVCYALAEA